VQFCSYAGGNGRDLGHDLRHGFGGPVERMRMLIPFTNERFDLGVELCFRVKIRDPQAVALEDAAPRLHLIHPGAVHQREVTERPGVLGSSLADLLAAVRPDVIAHEVNRLEVWGYLRIQLFKKGRELLLTLARGTWPTDRTRASVQCRKYI
jgi:hypothetical protein